MSVFAFCPSILCQSTEFMRFCHWLWAPFTLVFAMCPTLSALVVPEHAETVAESICERKHFDWPYSQVNQCRTGQTEKGPLSLSLWCPWFCLFTACSPYFPFCCWCHLQLFISHVLDQKHLHWQEWFKNHQYGVLNTSPSPFCHLVPCRVTSPHTDTECTS